MKLITKEKPMNKHLTLSLVLASGLVLSACSKKAPEMLPPDPGGSAARQSQQDGEHEYTKKVCHLNPPVQVPGVA